MDEDFFRDHLNDLFDSFTSHSAVKELMNNQQASDAVDFVHKNSKPILFTLSAVAAVFILTKLLAGGGNNSPGARKQRASKKLRKTRLRSEPGTPTTPLPQKIKIRNPPKAEPAIPLDPIDAANHLIDQITTEFEEDYEDAVARFFKLVDIRYAQLQGGEDGEAGKEADEEYSKIPKSPKSRGSYKEKLNYQYLYFNEHLLKLLMRLDTVETQGDDKLRQRRKDSIRFIQGFCKKLDQYKSKIDELANNGIEF